jgi:hypothetical protein
MCVPKIEKYRRISTHLKALGNEKVSVQWEGPKITYSEQSNVPDPPVFVICFDILDPDSCIRVQTFLIQYRYKLLESKSLTKQNYLNFDVLKYILMFSHKRGSNFIDWNPGSVGPVRISTVILSNPMIKICSRAPVHKLINHTKIRLDPICSFTKKKFFDVVSSIDGFTFSSETTGL